MLDTCSFAQLGPVAEKLRTLREKIVVVDHHATRDPVGGVQWTDTSAAAAGVMTAELIEALDWPLPDAGARALAVAVLSDTGWLKFSNADARALRVVAALVEHGVSLDEVFEALYQCDRPERLRLLERILASLELHHADRLAVMSVRRKDFEETGARPDETENLINEALRLQSVRVAMLLVENAENVRVSLRSRGHVNVADLARQFGGGGHDRAAGLRRTEALDEVRSMLIEALGEALAKAPASESRGCSS